jgi:hypothetical protein
VLGGIVRSWRWWGFCRLWLPLACLAMGGLLLGSIVGVASAALPDGRAWEMVSPPSKNGGDIRARSNGGGIAQASSDGEAITYISLASFGGPQGGPIASQYVASRGVGVGWMTQNISLPTSAQTYNFGGLGTPYRAFSSDLSSGLMWGGTRSGSGPVESPPLAGAPEGYENYYLNEIPSGALQPLLSELPSVPAAAFKLEYVGGTPNLEHDMVLSRTALKTGEKVVEGPVEGEGFYLDDWEKATGLLQPVNVLPNDVSEPASLPVYQAASEDGSRVVWTATAPPALYVREDIGSGHAHTVQADAPAGEGTFLAASADARRIFFADNNSLTGSPQDLGGLGDIYRFEPEVSGDGRLVDLTVDEEEPGGAAVQGVLGASADGSYLYFVANGVLASNASQGSHASQGNCRRGIPLPEDMCNLYVWHEGEGIKFIARLSSDDESGINVTPTGNALGVAYDWSGKLARRSARVSRDGMRLVFMSERSLTEYDNTVSTGDHCGESEGTLLPAQCQEVFLYEATAGAPGRLSCVSCNPKGTQPTGPSSIPGGAEFQVGEGFYQPRVLSEDGSISRVFFDSADGLVAADTNHVEDVYEYENGQVYLLSGGQSPGGASFVDASVDGDDVFFLTRGQLVNQDTDQLVDLYDARAPHLQGERVGFTVASESTAACEDEECRPANPPTPTFTTPSSTTFAGLGNVASTVSAPPAKPKPKKVGTKKVKAKKRKKAKRAKRARSGIARKAVKARDGRN